MLDGLVWRHALPYPPTRTPNGVTLAPSPRGHILHAMARRGELPG